MPNIKAIKLKSENPLKEYVLFYGGKDVIRAKYNRMKAQTNTVLKAVNEFPQKPSDNLCILLITDSEKQEEKGCFSVFEEKEGKSIIKEGFFNEVVD